MSDDEKPAITVNGMKIRDSLVISDTDNYFVSVPKAVVFVGTDGKMNRPIMAMMSGKQVKSWIAVLGRIK